VNLDDKDLIKIALEDLQKLGFPEDGYFFRRVCGEYIQKHTPCMKKNYEPISRSLRNGYQQFTNLYCSADMVNFVTNNMDHSILTGILAVRRMMGEDVNPWMVNAEGSI